MRKIALLVLVLVLSASSAPAAPPAAVPPVAKVPAAPPAKVAATPLKATVASVTGPAQKLLVGKGEKKWQPLKAGETLDEMTVIRTGFGAKVVVKFEDRAELTIRNASKGGLGQLRKEGDLAQAQLGLKYGSMRLSVIGRRGRNDFRLKTPVATLSIRQSDADVVFLVDSPNIVNAGSGNWQVTRVLTIPGVASQTTEQTVQGGETGNTKQDPPVIVMQQQMASPVADTFGTTGTEKVSLTNNQTGQRATNTPSGTNDPLPRPPVPPDEEPGYP